MRTGARFPLEEFEAAARRDERIAGVIHTGSVGHGGGDAFSDLDFELVYDAPIATARRISRDLCASLGEVRFSYWRGDLLTAFVGPSWQRVDAHVVTREALAPRAGYAGARVLLDRDGSIGEAVRASRPEAPTVEVQDARSELASAVDTQIYVALHAARGALWSALGELSFRQAELYRLLASLRGVAVFGMREAESILRPDERAAFERAWPREPSLAEIRRAAGALWAFSRLVFAAVEEDLGSEAVPDVPEAELLAAVDAVYARA